MASAVGHKQGHAATLMNMRSIQQSVIETMPTEAATNTVSPELFEEATAPRLRVSPINNEATMPTSIRWATWVSASGITNFQ